MRGVWLAVRCGTESPLHAAAFVAKLGEQQLLQTLQDALSEELAKMPEVRICHCDITDCVACMGQLTAARILACWQEGERRKKILPLKILQPKLARLNAAAPAHCTAESLSEELAQLRAYVSQSPQLELFQWRGIILRYKGPHLWAERHLPGSAKEEEGRMGAGVPYFYVDHDTEQTLYCSAGALVFD